MFNKKRSFYFLPDYKTKIENRQSVFHSVGSKCSDGGGGNCTKPQIAVVFLTAQHIFMSLVSFDRCDSRIFLLSTIACLKFVLALESAFQNFSIVDSFLSKIWM